MEKVSNTLQRTICKIKGNQFIDTVDTVVVEEPLEIQVLYFFNSQWVKKSLAITMRTPGNDEELAMGFLFTEGIINNANDIISIKIDKCNVLIIKLIETIKLELGKLERHFFATSSCGICGKASIEGLKQTSRFYPTVNLPKVAISVIQKLPDLISNTQTIFNQTGGIHAAGLFSPQGELLVIQEDIGRHNAVDKLIGKCLKIGEIPLQNHILMLSGRISFELVQKAMMAGIPIIAAVGAPSSLAIELAVESRMTLIGFLRRERFNVYCGRERLE